MGSFHSVAWSIAHGAAFLAIHAALGLALGLFAIGTAVRAIRLGHRAVVVWTVLAGLLVLGAGFNGLSFLDFADNVSSLIMALLAFAAVASYAMALIRLPPDSAAESPPPR